MKMKLTINRIADDNALRAKVQEALNVYDEYLKNKVDPEDATKASTTTNADGEKAEDAA
jgi:hypothetical protein